MPVSHIGLTVSHLPTSTSFFLSALQPLGYRYIGQQGNQVGLGISDADFFLCQETPGCKAGAAHIAFTAKTTAAVRDFYANALNAGGRPHGSPAVRNDESGLFNAAVLDFDGNSIEVVHRPGPDVVEDDDGKTRSAQHG
ncbi:Glyoxalase/Bleomycin resistance protein/Dihydroxybiphenyl dioxygenase [Lineolata rhizophorae]|uniref:Glyoxalase/Bleomycin resistance protein/Dihydroxybiphenyl dioxygenase n=1 Tax=Lineolata rhizophorae TaxID=578093 RepID=A0A6A6P6A1_9PEZI|nr:Glyoxalase/Bleomycin resistance protein/Dihydroxybiphenyl dioxygenase [Lineolata rhizophorae]